MLTDAGRKRLLDIKGVGRAKSFENDIFSKFSLFRKIRTLLPINGTLKCPTYNNRGMHSKTLNYEVLRLARLRGWSVPEQALLDNLAYNNTQSTRVVHHQPGLGFLVATKAAAVLRDIIYPLYPDRSLSAGTIPFRPTTSASAPTLRKSVHNFVPQDGVSASLWIKPSSFLLVVVKCA